MVPLLLLVYALANLGNISCTKINSGLLSGASRAKYSLYLSIVGVIACIFFWIFGGFNIGVNLPTLAFALAYALIAAASIILRMIAFTLSSVSGVNIIMSGCNLICSLGIGVIAFSEDITPIKLIRVALMLVSIIFTFLETKRGEKSDKGKTSGKRGSGIKLFVVLALIILVCCADTVTLKLFTLNTQVLDDNSFFFWTNVILVVGCLLIVLFEIIKKKGATKDILVIFKPKNLATTAGVTISSNAGSLTSLALIALMDVSVYTPVTAALGVVTGVVASLIFREKLGVLSYIAALLALVAVII